MVVRLFGMLMGPLSAIGHRVAGLTCGNAGSSQARGNNMTAKFVRPAYGLALGHGTAAPQTRFDLHCDLELRRAHQRGCPE